MSNIIGGCQCGAVRYEIDAPPVLAVHCQCTDCKKSSGAGHITAAVYPESALHLTGITKAYSSLADSGATATREFCPECGGRLTFRSTTIAGLVAVAAGSMDDPNAVSPSMAFYQKRHVAWDHLDPGLKVTEAGPPRN